MKLHWTGKALFDLTRLDNFLSPLSRTASARVLKSLTIAAERLLENPRIGYRLDQYAPREIRRIIVGVYELRYEIKDDTIFIMRVWHAREDR
jgi:plasmid stabilization system protein ParE